MVHWVFKIDGLHCGNCVRDVTNSLTEKFPNLKAEISLEEKRMDVTHQYDEKSVTSEMIESNVKTLGFSCVFEKMKKSEFVVDGLHCQNCVGKVTKALKEAFGEEIQVVIDLESKTMVLTSEEVISDVRKRTKSIVEKVGFSCKSGEKEELGENSAEEKKGSETKKFNVDGLHCQNCVGKVTNALKDAFGGSISVNIDLENKTMIVYHDKEIQVTNDKVEKLVRALEFECTSFAGKKEETYKYKEKIDSEESETKEKKKEDKESIEIVIDSSENEKASTVEESGKFLEKCELSIEGISCSSCVATIKKALSKQSGVKDLIVDVLTQRGRVQFDNRDIGQEKIIDIISKLGYPTKEVEEYNKEGEVVFIKKGKSGGMKNFLDYLKESQEVTSFNDLGKKITVIYDPNLTNPRILKKKALELGVKLSFPSSSNISLEDSLLRKGEKTYYRNLFIFQFVLTVPMMILMIFHIIPFFHPYLGYEIFRTITPMSIATFLIATPVHMSGVRIFKLGFIALFKFSPDKNTLISLGAWFAYLISVFVLVYGLFDPTIGNVLYLESSAMLLLFIVLGRWLENVGKSKTSSALLALMKLQPKEAILIQGCRSKEELMKHIKENIVKETTIEQKRLYRNDIIKILPGQAVPNDGVIILGESLFDESMMTGESKPVGKKVSNNVIGGTINIDGVVYVQITQVGKETVLNKIVDLIKETQFQKPKIEQLSDTISKYFVPTVLVLTIIVVIIWLILSYFVIPEEWITTNKIVFSLLFGASSLVIACPCSLGLAVPLAVMVGSGVAAKHKILIKSGECIESVKRAKIIAFDKTGTLTKGELEVVEFVLLKNPEKRNEYLQLVGIAESCTTHPISKGIINYVKKQTSIKQFRPPKEFKVVSGRGLKCVVETKRILVGNKKFMMEEKIDLKVLESKDQEVFEMRTLVFVAVNEELVGVFTLFDKVKPLAKLIIEKLKKWNFTVVMLTGDNESIGKSIANELGIDSCYSELTPFGKREKVQEFQKTGKVIFVGDGINDSAALTQSDVGIAIGNGTEIALECSDIVLMNESLESILIAIDICRKIFGKIVQNLFWAFIYNMVAFPLGAGALFPLLFWISGNGILPAWVGALAMSASSISVTVNSLLLRTFYKKPRIIEGKKSKVIPKAITLRLNSDEF